MKKILTFLLVFILNLTIHSEEIKTISPDGNIEINFRLSAKGEPEYRISYNNENFLSWSKLGLNFVESGKLTSGMQVVEVTSRTIDETYRIYSGKSKYSRNNCNETKVSLIEKSSPNRKLDIYLRAYNDGAAFRYGIPVQENLSSFMISTEETYYNFSGDYKCWAMKKDRFRHSYEGEYREYNLSNINNKPGDSTSYFPYITLPLTMKMNDG